jgi:hypothetical protein
MAEERSKPIDIPKKTSKLTSEEAALLVTPLTGKPPRSPIWTNLRSRAEKTTSSQMNSSPSRNLSFSRQTLKTRPPGTSLLTRTIHQEVATQTPPQVQEGTAPTTEARGKEDEMVGKDEVKDEVKEEVKDEVKEEVKDEVKDESMAVAKRVQKAEAEEHRKDALQVVKEVEELDPRV